MARVAWVADVHIGNHKRHGGDMVSGINERCRKTLAALKAACLRAKERGCERLFVAGDLFDNTRPSPQLIRAVQEIFEGDCPPVTLLLGNHDQVSTNSGDNALGPLAPICTVVDKTCTWVSADAKLQIWLVPFQPGDARKWLPSAISGLEGRGSGLGNSTLSSSQPPPSDKEQTTRVLAFHLGISDSDTPAFLQKAHDAVPVSQVTELCEQYGIHHVFSGNWHDRKVWPSPSGGSIFQTGALVPTGWDNPGIAPYGTLGILDSEEGMSFDIIPGPRFVKLKQADKVQETIDYAKELGHDLYVELTVEHNVVRECKQDAKALVQSGDVTAIQVVPDHKEAQSAAKASASAARSPDTLEEAINQYLKTQPLPEGVTVMEVLAKAKELLAC